MHDRCSNDESMDCLHEVPVCSLLVDVKCYAEGSSITMMPSDHSTRSFISLLGARPSSLSSKQHGSSWSSQRAGMTEAVQELETLLPQNSMPRRAAGSRGGIHVHWPAATTVPKKE